MEVTLKQTLLKDNWSIGINRTKWDLPVPVEPFFPFFRLNSQPFLCLPFFLLFIAIIYWTNFCLLLYCVKKQTNLLWTRLPLSLAISCSAWVHKCMGAQKRERVHWLALACTDLILCAHDLILCYGW